MANVWTFGRWTVKPGKEAEFVDAWSALAREGSAELGPPEPPTLLRDREQPNVFVSFGPWASDADVARFRSSSAFRTAQERMRDLLASFEPMTFDEVTRG
jgi:heme-degrading monooxygenase HmoA